MKKLIKLGISLFSVAILGATTPALIDLSIFGNTIVKAEEQQQRSINFRISFYDAETGEEIAPEMTGTIRPGESVNIHREISGYKIVSKISWMPNYIITYDMVRVYFHGDSDGYRGMYLDYRKIDPAPTPTPTPEPAPTPTPTPEKPDQGQQGRQGQNQKSDQAPGKQLPETGEESSTFTILLGLLTAGLAWLLRKKNC